MSYSPIYIPAQDTKQWKSVPGNDLFGSVVRTKNMDFSKDGYATLARKALALYTETDNANFEQPLAITGDANTTYIVTTGRVFSVDLTSNPLVFTSLTITDAPSLGLYSDALFFNGKLHVSSLEDIYSYNGSAWSSDYSGPGSTYPHPLCVSEHQAALAIGDGNLVLLINTSYALLTTLTLPQEYIVTCIRWRDNKLWIGTRNRTGSGAKVFVWNGSGSAAQAAYGVQADWVYSMCEYRSAMTVIASSGELLRFNGAGFDRLTTLPVYNTPYSWASSATTSSLIGNVASRGMQAFGDTLYININGELYGDYGAGFGKYLPDMPSGLWVYTPQNGLYHRAGYVYKTHLTLQPAEIVSNRLSFSTAHEASTGDAVFTAANNGITGLNEKQVYYAIVDEGATTALQLALSPSDAYEGRAVTIGGTPDSGDKFCFDRYESVSGQAINNSGPVFVFPSKHPSIFYGSEVLFAGEAFDQNLDSLATLMSLGMGRNVGGYVTSKIPSPQVEDSFQRIISKFSVLKLDTEKVVIKYRAEERYGFPISTRLESGSPATWASTSSFTFDSRQHNFKDVLVGDEIEITEGSGAGYSAHITAIDDSTDTYTVTIDETLPVTIGQDFDFTVDNWTKLTVITRDSNPNYLDVSSLNAQGKWVQFKVELRGFGVRTEEHQIINATHTKSK